MHFCRTSTISPIATAAAPLAPRRSPSRCPRTVASPGAANPNRPVRRLRPGLHAVVHATSDGTVGVTYYDFEHATAAQPGLTHEFIVHCNACAVQKVRSAPLPAA